MLDTRVSELLAPELDVDLVAPESIVRMSPGRLIGSTALSDSAIVLVGILIGLGVTVTVTGELALLLIMFPVVIGIGGFLIARVTRSLRYSIAATPDGVRVGFGLFSTTNETLPPGRIHSLKISQPLLWRPAGWWQIAVNRASRSSQSGAAGQQQTTILPVGNLDDVAAVVRLLLPQIAVDEALPVLELGLLGRGDEGDFTVSPRRARVLRWFSQPRNGFALTDEAVLMRTGAIWRSLTIVPLSRAQSVSVDQGPVLRSLGLASVHVHTVSGPISPVLGALDYLDAMRLFDEVADSAVRAAQADTSHRWRQQ
jgi:putative membrane protein